MSLSLYSKVGTYLKQSTAQSSTLPDEQKAWCDAHVTLAIANYTVDGDHIHINLGSDVGGHPVLVKGLASWYAYQPDVDILSDGKPVTVVTTAAAPPTPAQSGPLHINEKGLTLIKSFEGLVLTAYQDSVGVWTIGYGTTSGVEPGQTITEQQATDFLLRDVSTFETAVSNLVTAPLTSDQFSALVSFTYNLGPGALGESTLLRLLNQGNTQDAADEFLKWDMAGGQELEGLERRREAERALFLGQDFSQFLQT